jgi:hypothetical protein
MPNPPTAVPNFMTLAARATECCQQWRAWAQLEEKDSAQSRRAFELAALFQKQASILAAMHRNRTEWQKPTRGDLAR